MNGGRSWYDWENPPQLPSVRVHPVLSFYGLQSQALAFKVQVLQVGVNRLKDVREASLCANQALELGPLSFDVTEVILQGLSLSLQPLAPPRFKVRAKVTCRCAHARWWRWLSAETIPTYCFIPSQTMARGMRTKPIPARPQSSYATAMTAARTPTTT